MGRVWGDAFSWQVQLSKHLREAICSDVIESSSTWKQDLLLFLQLGTCSFPGLISGFAVPRGEGRLAASSRRGDSQV